MSLIVILPLIDRKVDHTEKIGPDVDAFTKCCQQEITEHLDTRLQNNL